MDPPSGHNFCYTYNQCRLCSMLAFNWPKFRRAPELQPLLEELGIVHRWFRDEDSGRPHERTERYVKRKLRQIIDCLHHTPIYRHHLRRREIDRGLRRLYGYLNNGRYDHGELYGGPVPGRLGLDHDGPGDYIIPAGLGGRRHGGRLPYPRHGRRPGGGGLFEPDFPNFFDDESMYGGSWDSDDDDDWILGGGGGGYYNDLDDQRRHVPRNLPDIHFPYHEGAFDYPHRHHHPWERMRRGRSYDRMPPRGLTY